MALSELKLIEKPQVDSADPVPSKERFRGSLHELEVLGEHLKMETSVRFQFRHHLILLRGIPEDFKCYFQSQNGTNILAFECCYGNFSQVHWPLVNELLSPAS